MDDLTVTVNGQRRPLTGDPIEAKRMSARATSAPRADIP